MSPVRSNLIAGAFALITGAACAQFVKGNEAVRLMPDGSKRVDVPPLPGASLAAPCPAERPTCTPSGWRMLETDAGLQECTEFYARPGTCRPSTYGAEKRSRVWVVKAKGQWLQCQKPSLDSKCVSIKALPYSEVQ